MEYKSTKVIRGLTVDNGGSELRVLPVGNSEVTKIPNDFVSIAEDAFRVKEVDQRSVVRIVEAPKESYIGIMATGMAGKAYNGTAIAISSQEPKTASEAYYRQFIYGVAYDVYDAYQQYKANNNVKVSSVNVNGKRQLVADVDFIYALVTCIPVKEHAGITDCVQRLKDALKGKYAVQYPLIDGMLTLHFEITEKFFGVVPEGGVAIVGLGKKLQPDDYSMIIDVGHVTTDIALFRGKDMLGKVVSSPYAGSTLIGNVRAALNDNGYYLSEEQTAVTIDTGFAKRGAREVDVSKIVAEQKEMFVSNYLKKEIIQVLNMNALNAAQVQNIVPMGAPMNKHGETGDMVDMIVNSCGFEYANVYKLTEDLRYVNIEVASKFTKGIAAKAEQYFKK